MTNFNYEVIGFKGSVTKGADYKGYVNVVLMKSNNNWELVNGSNFSKTKKVFIKNYFNTITPNKLFLLKVQDATSQSYYNSEDDSCEFESKVHKINDQYILDKDNVPPKDLIEIIERNLPSSDNATLLLKKEPITEYILIKNQDFCYGPFKWETLNSDLDGTTIQLKWFEPKFMGLLKKDIIYKINIDNLSAHLISFKDESGFDCDILNNFGSILWELNDSHKCEEVDYISTSDLITYGLKELDKITRSNSALKSFVNFIRQPAFENNFRNAIKNNNDTRLQRFLNISTSALSTTLTSSQNRLENINEIIKTLVVENPDVYGLSEFTNNNDLLNTVEHLENNISSLQEKNQKYLELDQLTNELVLKRQELTSIRDGHSQLVNEYKNMQQKMDESERLEAKIRDQENKIKELRDKYNIVEDYTNLQESIKKFDIENLETTYHTRNDVYVSLLEKTKKDIETKTNDLKELEDKINEMTNNFETKVRQQLVEIKPYINYVNGNFGNYKVEPSKIGIKYNRLENKIDPHKDIILYIKNVLKNNNRYFEDWQIANLLICLQQSFLTIFAGLPGTGKTSLARLLIKAQELDTRHMEVAVSRGWTSEKDLVGFYNPLISQFQPSNTGLYEFLLALSQESLSFDNNEISEVGMSYIILDEANLSPMEHYWSKFMGMTDRFNNKNHIKLGEISDISNNLRFIATINYDATTEMLSPRIIDRAPIIVLDHNQRIPKSDILDVINNHGILPVGANEMEELFGRSFQNNADFTTTREKEIFNEIKLVLHDFNHDFGLPVYISQRKEQSIKEYCAKAGGMMYDNENPLRALDLAILQFVLPQIKGHGTSFINRIEKLLEVIREHSLHNTASYLEKMISYAKNDFDTIDFFCW